MTLKGMNVFIFVTKKLSLTFVAKLKIRTRKTGQAILSLPLHHFDVCYSKQAYFPALPGCSVGWKRDEGCLKNDFCRVRFKERILKMYFRLFLLGLLNSLFSEGIWTAVQANSFLEAIYPQCRDPSARVISLHVHPNSPLVSY